MPIPESKFKEHCQCATCYLSIALFLAAMTCITSEWYQWKSFTCMAAFLARAHLPNDTSTHELLWQWKLVHYSIVLVARIFRHSTIHFCFRKRTTTHLMSTTTTSVWPTLLITTVHQCHQPSINTTSKCSCTFKCPQKDAAQSWAFLWYAKYLQQMMSIRSVCSSVNNAWCTWPYYSYQWQRF